MYTIEQGIQLINADPMLFVTAASVCSPRSCRR